MLHFTPPLMRACARVCERVCVYIMSNSLSLSLGGVNISGSYLGACCFWPQRCVCVLGRANRCHCLEPISRYNSKRIIHTHHALNTHTQPPPPHTLSHTQGTVLISSSLLPIRHPHHFTPLPLRAHTHSVTELLPSSSMRTLLCDTNPLSCISLPLFIHKQPTKWLLEG